MAALNLSTNGQSINRSYQAVIDAPAATGAGVASGSYGQWAIFSVAAPLATAFQDAGGKESILKVQGSGDGDLSELIDEFSDGRIQFAFVKVKDPNTSLPKYALIGWCGEGVPERTKGYFTSHLNTVSKVLTGYHVQITARNDRDLTPESIMQKVSDASGSKYSGGGTVTASAPPPKPATKPVFMPTQSSGTGGSFNPLAGGSRRAPVARSTNVDADGWGDDAPPVTRSNLEKVASAYQPTKVNMRELMSSKQATSSAGQNVAAVTLAEESKDVVKGGYQPIGKVDIAALRREAAANSTSDNRPTVVKGAYEPVGKVDIAAIKARARQEAPPASSTSPPPAADEMADQPPSMASRAAAFTSSASPLTSMPKPKVAKKFGGAAAFTGTKAPLPGGPGASPQPVAGPGASRTFADQGGKTPAQLWAEKKGITSSAPPPSSTAGITSPIASQTSGGGGWKSGYTGKTWAPVQTTKTGQSTGSNEDAQEEQPEDIPSGRVGALAEALRSPESGVPEPPPLATSTKPNASTAPMPMALPRAGVGLPPAPKQPRTPTPEPEEEDERQASPIRAAIPVSHSQPQHPVEDAHEEQFSPPPPMPIRSIAQEAAATREEPDPEPEPSSATDPARGAAAAVAGATFGEEAAAAAPSHTEAAGGLRAVVLYDYEKAEDNEIELVEGEYVSNIEQVDPDWWMGQTSKGDIGLFPSNYVELVAEESHDASAPAPGVPTPPHHGEAALAPSPPTATALYDYEAAEDNELTFPEGAKITNIEFPDEDWWAGEYHGHQGLFPANYVQLDQ